MIQSNCEDSVCARIGWFEQLTSYFRMGSALRFRPDIRTVFTSIIAVELLLGQMFGLDVGRNDVAELVDLDHRLELGIENEVDGCCVCRCELEFDSNGSSARR